MEFRQGTIADLNNICSLIAAAIKTMEEQRIHQWDEVYPTREDYSPDSPPGPSLRGTACQSMGHHGAGLILEWDRFLVLILN